MSFNDDEPIVLQDSGAKPTPIVVGRVQLVSKNNNTAPLDESKLKVMLELTGGDSSNDRPGLDLVAVLDVSGSMQGEKIEKVKTAMLFVIRKLSNIDRLSIVTFSADANRICPLRQITETSRPELENLINGLVAGGNTNITAGLQTGLKVLDDRKLTQGRTFGVMLMSDGEQNAGGDAAQVKIGNVPVYTFGFGLNHEPRVLKAIADNSMGGTFSDVQDTNNLSLAFSQCLAGLLTVVVQDLKVTVTQVQDESIIEQVSAGNYPQSKDDEAGSVTVSFGDLYSKEVRKVIVDLLLTAVETEYGAEVLVITYAYNFMGKLFDAPPAILTVRRSESSNEEERPEVATEQTRLLTARMIKEARVMADGSKLDDARDKIVEAQNALEDAPDQANPLIDNLRNELQQLLKFLKTQELYDKQGRPFALSSETSHDRQRFAARGDIENLRAYATPRMDKYLEQAKKFDEDPSQPLPSVEEDVKEELAANPLGPIAGPISFYIQEAIKALQAIDKLITKGV